MNMLTHVQILDETNTLGKHMHPTILLSAMVGSPRGVMVKAMDFGIIVCKFEILLCYYVHFRKNTLGKGMNLLILPAMGEIVSLLFFLIAGLVIK